MSQKWPVYLRLRDRIGGKLERDALGVGGDQADRVRIVFVADARYDAGANGP